ncbi:MAG: transposase [Desulfobacterales bacterium]|nr:transposase [Desulfobacterales bacterium]
MARIAPRGHVFHVLTRGNNRQDVFLDIMDYQTHLEILKKYKEKLEFKVYHYVLMKNHVHLVLETLEEGGSLAEVMKGINLSYAQHYKRRYDHIGHFWQDRFKSILISKDQYLLACGSYVELNPVRAGLVKDPRDYRWSSYNSYAYGKEDSAVDEHPIYQGLSRDGAGRRRKYGEFVMGRLRAGDGMRGEMNRRVIYGDKTLTAKISKEYKVAEVTRLQGRPKKKD